MDRLTRIDKWKGLVAMVAVGEALGLAHDDVGARGVVRSAPAAAWPSFAEAYSGSSGFRVRWSGHESALAAVPGVPGPIAAALFAPDRSIGLDVVDADVIYAVERAIAGVAGPRLGLLASIRDGARVESEASRDAIGLFGVILAEAFATTTGTKHVHYWFSETVRKRLPLWIESEPRAVDPAALEHWRGEWQNMVTLAINLRGRSIDSYLAALGEDHRGRTESGRVSAGDPALLLKYAAAHLTFTAAGFTNALRVSGSGPGRTARLGALIGAWVGAYYGFARLADFERPDEPILQLLATADSGARAVFGAGLDQVAENGYFNVA